MVTYAIRRLGAQAVGHAVITAAMKVHTELRPGWLESTYQACLQFELRDAGFRSEAQVGLPVVYRGAKLDLGYRMDLLVENLVIVEIKSVEGISHSPSGAGDLVFEAQRQINRLAHQLQCCAPERWNQALGERNFVEGRSKAVTTKDTKVHEETQAKFFLRAASCPSWLSAFSCACRRCEAHPPAECV